MSTSNELAWRSELENDMITIYKFSMHIIIISFNLVSTDYMYTELIITGIKHFYVQNHEFM